MLNKIKNQIDGQLHWFLLIIITYIPFYRLVQAILENHTRLSGGTVFWLSHWYEPVAIILLSYYLIVLLSLRRRKVGADLIFALILLAMGIISIFLGAKGISRGLEGFRFVLFPIVIFATAYLADFDKNDLKKFINVYITTAIVIGLWAVIEHCFPSNYWSSWGILSSDASTWFGSHTVDGIRQSVSFIGGPNQLATYLLPAFFILLSGDNGFNKTLRWLTVILLGIAITLTFSRSAFIGLAVSLFLFSVLNKNNFIRWYGLALSMLLLVIVLFAYQFGNSTVKSIFTHGASQSGHVAALNESVSEIKSRIQNAPALIFGKGLGSAGPAAIKYGDGIVSESWYLEIILELGLLGIFIWLLYFVFLVKKTINSNNGLFFGFISIAVASLFLHTLSDNPAGTFILFALLGIHNSFAGQK
jgi:hypothetical protein